MNNPQYYLDAALDLCEASQEFRAEGNLEKATEALDQAYSLILKVDPGNRPKLIQQKEDLRFTISRRILETHASRYTAVSGNHAAIPLPINEEVKFEIKSFQTLERKYFLEAYKRSGRYRPAIVEKLKMAGMPEELSWLPLIESGFKIRALSPARALGLWQFIPSTGYKFGLNRDTWIDERLDPQKATDAAIEYLRELHQIFGDWTTCLAAYNCGEGAVLRKIRTQQIDYLDNFWDLYQKLPRETARYVPRFIATLQILKDPGKYGFTLPEPDGPVDFEVVSISKQVHLQSVAEALGVSLKDLADLNPELRLKVTPPDLYSLKVPMGKGAILVTNLADIPEWTMPKSAYVHHRVKKGETLSQIALKYRTSVTRIVQANHLNRKNFIKAGELLKIPRRGANTKGRVKKTYRLLPGGRYRVQKGDSLWKVARKFKTTTKILRQINNLPSTCLQVGQILQITAPKARVESADQTSRKYYTVKMGDSLYRISQKYGMSVSEFLRLNNLSPDCTIHPGQVLTVKE